MHKLGELQGDMELLIFCLISFILSIAYFDELKISITCPKCIGTDVFLVSTLNL